MRAARLLVAVALALLAAGPAQAQQGSPTALNVLVDQLVDLFPKVEGDVIEVQGTAVTLSAGRKDGVGPGLELVLYREGRELRHPKTGALLGRAEQTLGRVVVTEVQEAFARGRVAPGTDVKPGDRFRISAAKVKLVMVPLLGGAREALVEAATQELVERLAASGRFQVAMGDTVGVFLAERGIRAEEFLEGKGVREAAERVRAEHLLVLHFKRVQQKPFMEVRFFSLSRPEPLVSTAFFVPPSIRAAPPGGQFSASGRVSNPPQAKPRSFLARLLGGELEAGSYSAGESTIPLREVARFGFPVAAMDVSVAPRDKLPRMVVSDGERGYLYRIVNQRLEPEWSISLRTMGQVLTIQLVDLDGDGVFEVVGSRFHPKSGLNSFVIKTVDGKPRLLEDDVSLFLFAADVKGEGVKQTVWAQRYTPERFFTTGQAEQMVLRSGRLVAERPVRVPSTFRPMGATFSNIMGKDSRSLVFVDEFNRLRIATADGEELWRSATSVGGGTQVAEQPVSDGRITGRARFYPIEPTPVAVDLDGDGIEEVVVPQNKVKEGLLAVVFKGPAGLRLQSVESGFEGIIMGLGAFRTEDSVQPTLVAAVVRHTNFLKTSGETQIIMTLPQD